nr:tetratricopeptide repeat protein [uncultured Methanospirillum sp.]
MNFFVYLSDLFPSLCVPGNQGYTEAAELLQQYLQENENDPKAWNALGVICSKSGQYKDASTCFENAMVCDPDNPVYLKNLERNRSKLNINNPLLETAREKETQSSSRKLLSSPPFSNPRMVYGRVMIGVLIVVGLVFMGLSGYLATGAGSHLNTSPDTQKPAVSTPLAPPLPALHQN